MYNIQYCLGIDLETKLAAQGTSINFVKLFNAILTPIPPCQDIHMVWSFLSKSSVILFLISPLLSTLFMEVPLVVAFAKFVWSKSNPSQFTKILSKTFQDSLIYTIPEPQFLIENSFINTINLLLI